MTHAHRQPLFQKYDKTNDRPRIERICVWKIQILVVYYNRTRINTHFDKLKKKLLARLRNMRLVPPRKKWRVNVGVWIWGLISNLRYLNFFESVMTKIKISKILCDFIYWIRYTPITIRQWRDDDNGRQTMAELGDHWGLMNVWQSVLISIAISLTIKNRF